MLKCQLSVILMDKDLNLNTLLEDKLAGCSIRLDEKRKANLNVRDT